MYYRIGESLSVSVIAVVSEIVIHDRVLDCFNCIADSLWKIYTRLHCIRMHQRVNHSRPLLSVSNWN